MADSAPKTDSDDKPIPKAPDAAAAAKLMMRALFDAASSGEDAAGPISFTMSPNDDGTVDLTGTEAIIAAIGARSECPHRHEIPCFWKQREDEINDYMEYLFNIEEMNNKERRFKMYRYLSGLYEGFLGKHVRKELPKCLVGEVKDTFPKDKDDVYTGFKEVTSEELEGE